MDTERGGEEEGEGGWRRERGKERKRERYQFFTRLLCELTHGVNFALFLIQRKDIAHYVCLQQGKSNF